MVIVQKKAGDIRMCVDMSEVNKAAVPDRYPFPTVDEHAAQFHGANEFTKLDLRQRYLQITLTEESRNLTTFIT